MGGERLMYDTIIVGGGIGGLQTAIQLARSMRRVAVIDTPGGRSTVAKSYRNILGFEDGVSGVSLRRQGRKQAAKYGAVFFADEVIKLESQGKAGFLVHRRNAVQPLECRTLVMATGIKDPFPAIPGIEECLGTSIFLCPDCDGYETIEQRTAVIGAVPQAIEMADELTFYTSKIYIINHEQVPVQPELRKTLSEKGYTLLEVAVERMLHDEGRLRQLILATGEHLDVTRAFLSFPGAQVQTALLKPLSVRLNPKGHVLTNPRTKETDHPNLWAVGDIVEHSQQVAIAMGDGAQAAIWIQKRLREQGFTERR
ncbi:NAD(P)/FAD-dependent oxidoreductase [Brevibacillus centrosporus]|uniref:NAD(P)/FAD-dependent oxidoreductase n=1 Tax=Brevibacillus centrosporus TaxID=54910 RepID=UPI003D1F6F5B